MNIKRPCRRLQAEAIQHVLNLKLMSTLLRTDRLLFDRTIQLIKDDAPNYLIATDSALYIKLRECITLYRIKGWGVTSEGTSRLNE